MSSVSEHESIMDLSWIPENPIDLINSVREGEIIECTTNDVNQITIFFPSGVKLVIVNFQNCKLIVIKQLLVDLITNHNHCDHDHDDDYDYDYDLDLDFIINLEHISNTIRVPLDNIKEITCIIKKISRNIMIAATCTSCNGCHNGSQSWNIECMGEICTCGDNGLLIPKYFDGKSLYDSLKNEEPIPDESYNIPEKIKDDCTDRQWMRFIDYMKSQLILHFKSVMLWGREEEDDHIRDNNFHCDYDYYLGLSDDNFSGLTEEQANHRYYSLLNFSRYHNT